VFELGVKKLEPGGHHFLDSVFKWTVAY
jgi:hypothetical protein